MLDDLQIASPCPASWAEMKGDDRVRFCVSCSKHVYDISSLTRAEAESLIEGAEGSLCVQLYRRRDGTVLTADCPVGLRHSLRRRLLRVATAGVMAFAFLRSGLWAYAHGRSFESVPYSGVRLTYWVDRALSTLGIRPTCRVTGAIRTVPARIVSPPPPPIPVDEES